MRNCKYIYITATRRATRNRYGNENGGERREIRGERNNQSVFSVLFFSIFSTDVVKSTLVQHSTTYHNCSADMEHTTGTLSTWPWSTSDPIFHSTWTKPREIGQLLLGDVIVAVNGRRVSAKARGESTRNQVTNTTPTAFSYLVNLMRLGLRHPHQCPLELVARATPPFVLTIEHSEITF